jgi:uncharacterized protein YggE
MTTRSTVRATLASTIFLGLAFPCHAQFSRALAGLPSSSSITGTGTVVTTYSPQTMRLRVDLSGTAKNAKDAVAKLKAVSEAATGKLADLDAEKDSVKIGPPRVTAAVNDQRRQMEMMVRQRMRGAGKKPKAQPEPPVVVSATLSAEWKLNGKDAAARLLEAREIEDKIKAADLAGNKQKSEEASEEEEEMAEEMNEQFMGGNDNQPKPGEPMFIYVAKVDDEGRSKALASAFAKARTEAEQLAAAAGVKLGPLRGVQAHAGRNEYENYQYQYMGGGMNPYMLAQMGMSDGEATGGTPREAIGMQPGETSLNYSVSASFEIAGQEK